MPAAFVIPGDIIPTDDLPIPSNASKSLKLGPGLRHTPPSTFSAVLAGPVCIEPKKNAIWVENNTGRVNDEVSSKFQSPFLFVFPSLRHLSSPTPALFEILKKNNLKKC